MNHEFKKWKYNRASQEELLIVFPDKKYIGLEELLNTEGYAISLEEILEKIDIVLAGDSKLEKIGTERSFAEIRKEETKIYDLFEGMIPEESINPTILMSTEKLKGIIVDVQKHLKEFKHGLYDK